MKKLSVLAMVALTAACAPGKTVVSTTAVSVPGTTSTVTKAVPASDIPTPPTAGVTGTCAYLDKATVESYNGQHVGSVKTGSSQSCFFYRPDGGLQLSVWIYRGTPIIATAVVNQAAPIASSDPANSPTGWTGGTEPTDNGAVYAIAKGGTAVVVDTNQQQTIKAKRVAVQVVANLKL